MKSIGILGGTFNPIHLGHLITAQILLEKRNLEKIIFIPCNISPHKIEKEQVEPFHRLKMVQLAIEKNKKFTCDDYEIKKGDISYTLNTLEYLNKKFDNLELIIGYDNLLTFDKWHKPNDILKIAKLIVMERTIEKGVNPNHKYFDKAIFVKTPTIEISSTQIRERIRKNLSVDFMLPQNVTEYIKQNNLYK